MKLLKTVQIADLKPDESFYEDDFIGPMTWEILQRGIRSYLKSNKKLDVLDRSIPLGIIEIVEHNGFTSFKIPYTHGINFANGPIHGTYSNIFR